MNWDLAIDMMLVAILILLLLYWTIVFLEVVDKPVVKPSKKHWQAQQLQESPLAKRRPELADTIDLSTGAMVDTMLHPFDNPESGK